MAPLLLKVNSSWSLFSFHRPLYTLRCVHLRQLLSAGFGRAEAGAERWVARPHTHVLRLVPGLSLSLLYAGGGLWLPAHTCSTSHLSSAKPWIYCCFLYVLKTTRWKRILSLCLQQGFHTTTWLERSMWR